MVTSTVVKATALIQQRLPHCYEAERCDACENLFTEIFSSDRRYVFVCTHVFCQPCMIMMQAQARRGKSQMCPRCPSFISRKEDLIACPHPINFVEIRPGRYRHGEPVFDPRCELLIGQHVHEKCQKCALTDKLAEYSLRIASQVSLLPYTGEVYACLQVNGHIIHGMVCEPRTAVPDLINDVEMPRAKSLIEDDVGTICGFIAKYPMEPHFFPFGDITLTYRLRGFRSWMDHQSPDSFVHYGLKHLLSKYEEEKRRIEAEQNMDIVFNWD